MGWTGALCVAWLLLGAPSAAQAQLFFGSRPDPDFTIGPLTIRAVVSERPGPVEVQVLWGVTPPPRRRVGDVAQDLYLLWPGEVESEDRAAKPDPALTKYVEKLGFDVIAEGRLPLRVQSLDAADAVATPALLPGGAPFVVFVQYSKALGITSPATFIRIPWTPQMADGRSLVELRMTARGLVKPKRANWAERLVLGERSRLSMSYNEVRDRPLFEMYLAHRDRVIHLADAPAELVAHFSNSDHLKIDEIFPPTSIRRLDENLESTEVVSLFLDKAEGFAPQNLAVQFGYYSRAHAVLLVVVPILFFVLGNAMGPVLGRAALKALDVARARIHWGTWGGPRQLESGVILDRQVLARIVPGVTRREDVRRLCGAEAERQEQWSTPDREVLIYRGRRLVPEARRIVGWLSAVRHWDVERHEVRVELERGIVRDVQAQTRRYRLAPDEPE